MSIPGTCPSCGSFDVRGLTNAGTDLRGYCCHDCAHTFFIAVKPLGAILKIVAETPRPRKSRHKRRPA